MRRPTRTTSLAAHPEAKVFIVHGRVQGVWFRDSTRREAQRLDLSGHAINLPDGNVEVLAYGRPEALVELEKWLHTGPPMASVTQVAKRQCPERLAGKLPPTGFSIG